MKIANLFILLLILTLACDKNVPKKHMSKENFSEVQNSENDQQNESLAFISSKSQAIYNGVITANLAGSTGAGSVDWVFLFRIKDVIKGKSSAGDTILITDISNKRNLLL